MADSGKWWLPLTVGVGAVAAVTAFQIITRSEETSDSHDIVENAKEPDPLDPAEDVKPTPTCEESLDNAGITQFDEPVASAVVQEAINANTDPGLEESYCEVSPKAKPSEKVDNAWRSWGWFFNS